MSSHELVYIFEENKTLAIDYQYNRKPLGYLNKQTKKLIYWKDTCLQSWRKVIKCFWSCASRRIPKIVFPFKDDNIASLVPQCCRQWTLTMSLAEWPLVLQKLDATVIAPTLTTRMDYPLSLFFISITRHSKLKTLVSD